MSDRGNEMKAWREPAVLAQAGVVTALIALLALSEVAHDGPDANIGAGLVGLVLAGFGAPWSLGCLVFGYVSDSDDPTPVIFVCLTAVLNVAIHAADRARCARHRAAGRDLR